MKEIAAVVVTYNRNDKLAECIKALLDQTSLGEMDILVVDNGDCSDTEAMLKRMAYKYEGRETVLLDYLSTGHNIGGAGGYAYGIRQAIQAGYKYVWLMDDDCMPEPDALEELLLFDRTHRGEYGFVCSKVLWKDGRLHRMNVPRETVFKNLRNWKGSEIRVEMASFVSLFIPADVIRTVGLPIRQFFIWTDDWEYTRRISMKYPCWLAKRSRVVHDTAVNRGADIASAEPDKTERFRYLYRNDVYLYRREGWKGLLYEAVRIPVHIGRIAVSRGSVKDKLRKAGIVIKGTAEGLRFWPETEMIDK